MSKIAFLFPGQGAQYIGMGKDFSRHFKESDKIFEEASEALGYDMKQMLFDGDMETLSITENTQPAILATSIACMQPLLERGIKPQVAAGLSIGEFGAHVLAGTFNFRDAVRLVRNRGRYIQDAVPLGSGTMAAIIGLEDSEVEKCCKEASKEGIVEPANYNCPGQVVISGETKAIEKAIILCKKAGAKNGILLRVSAPFHCSMLKSAGEKLALDLENIKVYDMELPIVANVNGKYVTNKLLVKNMLVKQVSSPVFWGESIKNMIDKGIEVFIEMGPGKILSGFLKRINKKVKVYNVETIESLNETLKEVGLY